MTTPNAATLHIVGAGWAGLCAAIEARRHGLRVHLHEASQHPGGRARQLPTQTTPPWQLDNGQHILIGAYRQTLSLMAFLGLQTSELFVRIPPDLRLPNADGFRMYPGCATWGLLRGVWQSQGWGLKNKIAFLAAAIRWQLAGFTCPPSWRVLDLCTHYRVPRIVQHQLIDPLCISALNTPSAQASAQVFLRVLHDAFFSSPASSDLLIPKVTLSELFPIPAVEWLQNHKTTISWSDTVQKHHVEEWISQGDYVLLACPSWQAAKLCITLSPEWSAIAQTLPYKAITTVYLSHNGEHALDRPLQALANSPVAANTPAQFLFDHASLSNQPKLLAAVCSDAPIDDAQMAQRVLQQIAELGFKELQIVQTITEKRATFACIPNLNRPSPHIAPRLMACGDYIAGPYPATLEGAIRSAQEAITSLTQQML
jgi:hydroxysqualene dehydroxylase